MVEKIPRKFFSIETGRITKEEAEKIVRELREKYRKTMVKLRKLMEETDRERRTL